MGQTQHGHARTHHLTCLGIDASDHTGFISHQFAVGHLVGLSGQLRLRLVDLGLGGFQGGFTPLKFGAADEFFVTQFFVTLEIGGGQIAVGDGGVDLCASGIHRQAVVLRVDLCQQLTGLDTLA